MEQELKESAVAEALHGLGPLRSLPNASPNLCRMRTGIGEATPCRLASQGVDEAIARRLQEEADAETAGALERMDFQEPMQDEMLAIRLQMEADNEANREAREARDRLRQQQAAEWYERELAALQAGREREYREIPAGDPVAPQPPVRDLDVEAEIQRVLEARSQQSEAGFMAGLRSLWQEPARDMPPRPDFRFPPAQAQHSNQPAPQRQQPQPNRQPQRQQPQRQPQRQPPRQPARPQAARVRDSDDDLRRVLADSAHDRVGFARPGARQAAVESVTTTLVFTGESTEEKCLVCYDEFAAGDNLRLLPCLHKFHVACVDRWLQSSRTCPICKLDIQQAR